MRLLKVPFFYSQKRFFSVADGNNKFRQENEGFEGVRRKDVNAGVSKSSSLPKSSFNATDYAISSDSQQQKSSFIQNINILILACPVNYALLNRSKHVKH